MTAFLDDPTLNLLTDQTDLVMQDVAALEPDQVRARSLLPGWTRGHVLSHLARNADALGNLVTTVLTGVPTPMYPSRESRDRDIDEGSVRPVSDLEADLESSSERFLARLADLNEAQLDDLVPTGRGTDVRVRDLPWMRTLEIVVHHVDLDVGFTFDDLPTMVLRRALDDCVPRLSGSPGRTTIVGTLPDGTTTQLVVGADPDASPARVSGSAASVLAWLTGRSDGSELEHDAPLPTLPSWG